jgi:uncharacterized protein (TIGR02996 family)
MLFPLVQEPVLPDDPDRDPQESAFLTSILEDPDDDATRLIFADWLEENGQADKSAFVRLEVGMSQLPQHSPRYPEIRDQLLRLDEAIGKGWSLSLIRTGRLLNCGGTRTKDPFLRFAYQCPNRWTDLRATADESVRYCAECRKNVHFCASKHEAEAHAVQGHCIAIGSRLALAIQKEYAPALAAESGPPAEDELAMGEVMGLPLRIGGGSHSPYELWAEELFARHRKRWWQFWR